MAILKIARMGHPVLRRAAEPVPDPSAPEIRRLVRDMIETLEDIGGAGLAAPQIHESVRIAVLVLDEQTDPHIWINPVITPIGDEMISSYEGCLSVPGLYAPTVRAMRAAVEGFDVHGKPVRVEGTGLMARCLQHEVDHLDGKVFLDRLAGDARKAALRALRNR